MSLSEIRGNELLKMRLKKIIHSGRIPHGSIFEGEIGTALQFAEEFARAVLCEDRQDDDSCGRCHSCLRTAGGNSTEILYFGTDDAARQLKVDQVREMRDAALNKSYSGRPLFIIVRNTARMLESAQAAMLKILEEPPEGVYIILVTANSTSLMKTILSRCQLFRTDAGVFRPAIDDPEEKKRARALIGMILDSSPFYSMAEEIEHFAGTRKSALGFVDEAELMFRNMMVKRFDPGERLIADPEDAGIVRSLSFRCGTETTMAAIEAAELARRDLNGFVGAVRALKYMVFDIQDMISRESRSGGRTPAGSGRNR